MKTRQCEKNKFLLLKPHILLIFWYGSLGRPMKCAVCKAVSCLLSETTPSAFNVSFCFLLGSFPCPLHLWHHDFFTLHKKPGNSEKIWSGWRKLMRATPISQLIYCCGVPALVEILSTASLKVQNPPICWLQPLLRSHCIRCFSLLPLRHFKFQSRAYPSQAPAILSPPWFAASVIWNSTMVP